jgi:hypothetical protein
VTAAQPSGPGDRRGRLTPHQTEVLTRLRRLSGDRRHWVAEKSIGSHGALWHLIRKGHVEVYEASGPRGGVRYAYRPIPDALAAVGWHHREFPGYESRDFWCECGCGARLNTKHALQRIAAVGSVRYAVDADHAERIDAQYDRPPFEAVARLEVRP